MRLQIICGLIVAVTAPNPCFATERNAAPQIEQAAEWLREARAICEQDHGELWGKTLCGPILLVDPATRTVFANQSDPERRLQPQGNTFTATLPTDVNVANTATDWAGVKWTMLMLPLPAERTGRGALLAHEMWHRIQDQLGFAASTAANDHLDTRDGRYWLQLEWRALAAALAADGEEQTRAIIDAVLFRARRRQLFPNAAREESSMEMHEGLAEYTGVHLSGTTNPRQFVINHELEQGPTKQTFVRSFAYATGPAYGLLLDETRPTWRKTLRPTDDLALLLLRYRNVFLPGDIGREADRRAAGYGAAALAAAEEDRERSRREQEKFYRSRLLESPVLVLPLRKMKMQFDPRNLVPLPGIGTVYPNIRIVDVWGVLEVREGGALMSADFSTVTVPAPHDLQGPKIEAEGWSLQLSPLWRVRPGGRDGSYLLEEQSRTN